MNSEADGITYARTQVDEARRRLNSVHERVTEIEEKTVMGLVDEKTDEIIYLHEYMGEIPEEDATPVVLNREEKEISKIDGHIQNIIIDCQMCIELSVKSMFKAVGQDFDYSHGIGFESHNTKNFNREVPSEYSRREDIIRATFLTQLWEKFYQFAKYGAPELNAGPSMIFDIHDGERAMNDAEFCVELAEDFIDFIQNQPSDD